MTTLIFGVDDIPYVRLPDNTTPRMHKPPKIGKNGQPLRARKPTAPTSIGVHTESGAQTTGDVAGWLENKYHVMEIFYELHEEEIVEIIGRWYLTQHEAAMMGGSPNMQGFIDEIAVLFHQFIDTKEMDGTATPGVPTKASLKGIDHRRKNNRGVPGRPSFRDTGNYEDSFRAWLA